MYDCGRIFIYKTCNCESCAGACTGCCASYIDIGQALGLYCGIELSEIIVCFGKGCVQRITGAITGYVTDVDQLLRHYLPSYLIFMQADR